MSRPIPLASISTLPLSAVSPLLVSSMVAAGTLAPTPTLPAVSLLVAVVRSSDVFDGFAALHVEFFFL